jgi:hypothetical protein|nr:MAG TPA: DNA polymerase B [Caudoviricetes sp.]
MKVYFDIETAPLDSDAISAVMPKFTANANIKDAAKIEANIEEKRLNFIANAALDATTGRVVAIGYALDEGEVFAFANPNPDGEAELIDQAWRAFVDSRGVISDDIIGHNSNKFDLPFLIRRSRILGIEIPPTVMTWSRGRQYLDSHFKDTMDAWACGTADKISLDTLAKSLGVGAKNGEGKDFYSVLLDNPTNAIEYLKNDIELTRACAKRLGL